MSLSERIKRYFNVIVRFFQRNNIVVEVRIEKLIISQKHGYIKLRIILIDGRVIEIREFIDASLTKIKYAYSFLQRNKVIFRYDNAPHHKEITSFPHHKHTSNEKIIATKEPNIFRIKKEVLKTL